ncbi:MAG: hypothetical protein LBP22_02365 [Deltaproteobacteria bacterium]|nr:hypothetical protein [Deltaproteobacteria bacterium]
MAAENFSEESDVKLKTDVMSTPADPIVEKIYKDVTTAGRLAVGSFISAVLAECGEKFGNVTKLRPETRLKPQENQGCIVDVSARSDTNRINFQEFQLYFNSSILQRNVFSASHLDVVVNCLN